MCWKKAAITSKARTKPSTRRLLDDAEALAEAGAFAIVLELVTPPVAKEITQTISIPTIGIGSGPDCDGQILVTPDLLGTFPVVHAEIRETKTERRRTDAPPWSGMEKIGRNPRQ